SRPARSTRATCATSARATCWTGFERPRTPRPVVRVLLQRVSRAEVRVGERVTGRIGVGYLLLVGLTGTDSEDTLRWMAEKVAGLRLFADDEGKMNLALYEVGGAVLVISQF